MATLFDIPLIDAYRVCPHNARSVWIPNSDKGCTQVHRDVEGASIALDWHDLLGIAPHIRYCVELRSIGQGVNCKFYYDSVVTSAWEQPQKADVATRRKFCIQII
jgi:hypothetical protein